MNFSQRSINNLHSCHGDLVRIMKEAIKISNVDFAIVEGFRSKEKQLEYFSQGKSKVRKSKHNLEPSMACDIVPYIEGRVDWDKEHLSYLAGLIHGISEILYMKGGTIYKIRWGGNWDMDGTILLDQSFDDRPHFELVRL